MEIYLDNSATTRPYKQCVDYVSRVMYDMYGNPSSLHRKGVEAEKALKQARERVADTIGASVNEIFFTSGGTESDNLAIMGVCAANKGRHIISTKIEHPANLNTLNYMSSKGYKVDLLPVTHDGVIDINTFERMVAEDTVLVSIMHVNNEIGSIQPIEKISSIIKGKKLQTYLHVDAVQSYCKIPFTANSLGADLISLSSHKIHGPKGVGALYVKGRTKISPIIYGGGQQSNLRPGTENVPGFAGFGLAAEMCYGNMKESIQRMERLRNKLKNGISDKIEDVYINTPKFSAPHILNVSFAGVKSEILLHSLEIEGIYVSSGSACSSHKSGLSYVLASIGTDRRLIEGSIRFSLSEFTTAAEIDFTIESLVKIVAKLRKLHKK